jgi:valyl-tRNA synthetase
MTDEIERESRSPNLSSDLDKAYDPRGIEARWYPFWEQQGVFKATDAADDSRPVYVIPMPPPNVTGSLHMGHALFLTLQDALVRFHRMRGFNVLWQPGIDHAGIATQTVVERHLAREGKTRHDIGREAFEARVWEWKAQSGDRIFEQFRVMGTSADWERSKFTMDPDMVHAVRVAFVRLHEQGLMYRATRLINWDPAQQTSLSDLEVDHEETNGELFEFAYKIEGTGGEIVVATTRPETMLGDTAVAVHPDDPRYKALHGKFLAHPFVDRRIPIITDAILVDPKFGTGAVKVTPAHDFNDFATGKRHGLAEVSILGRDGAINDNGGKFKGLDRARARTAVKKALDELGLARGSKPHRLTVPKSQRSGAVVEPMISTQWFLNMSSMAARALDAVKKGDTVIIPAEWQKTYDHFLENIQDWCVSRQLWWGHQIPAWHGPNGEIRVALERPADLGPEWTPDPDVLDTWFSAGLWPFATLGWPRKTDALAKFYPASCLETGYDILFFWVARMMMFGLHFMDDVPFRQVLLHGLIVDETGEKMSKVKGNVIDPLDLVQGATFAEIVKKTLPGAPETEAISKFTKAYPSVAGMGSSFPAFGADAVRFTLATYPPSNKRIALAPKRIEGNRHFINKVWNATRFSLEHVKSVAAAGRPEPRWVWSRWILSRLAGTLEKVHTGFGSFRLDDAATELYRFFWTDVCDWYLELSKTVLAPSADASAEILALQDETRATLAHVLETSLRALHPLIPYVTEELWQRIPKGQGHPATIALAAYPTAETDGRADPAVERDVGTIQAAVTAARTTRSEYEVHPGAQVPLSFRADAAATALLRQHEAVIARLVKASGSIVVEAPGGPRPKGTVATIVKTDHGVLEVLVGLKGLVTAAKERARIEGALKKITKDLTMVDKKLASPSFADRAPKEIVEDAKIQRAGLIEARARLEASRVLADELDEEIE